MHNAADSSVAQDRSDIAQVILRWGYFRDHGMWDALRDTFHPDGKIRVTWYVGLFDGFVEASKEMAEGGAKSAHVMKPSIVDVAGDRAVAITPALITGRAKAAAGLEVDLVTNASFFDFFEKKDGEWRISSRICVYQSDRMDSVGPSIRFRILYALMGLGKHNPAFKHLAAALDRQGFPIQEGQVIDHTDQSRALYASAQDWLQGNLDTIPEPVG